MSRNLQWNMFETAEEQNILELHHSNIQSKHVYKSGPYSSEYPNSPRETFQNVGNNAGSNNFTSSMGDSMGVFSSSNPTNNSTQHYEPVNNPPIRETGIIEKLLHSYGFIQCCERQARLFFHFSQFSGNIEHLKIGDPVEFEMTYDRRTGKPIASTVTKIAPEVVLSEARVTGTVTTELKGEGSGDNTGRISYENRGECFFLPYTKDDVEGNVTLKSGDAVSFQIATNQRGTLGACHIRFENPAHPVKYHGVVCSMKENFGFIERADVVKEIFFHFSEAKTKEELVLGDDVEFIIQTRNGKEVACNITKMASGSVVFEDVSPEIMRGQVLKPLERGSTDRNDPLPGRIRYRALDHSEVEVPFGDKDQCGEFTLRHGDWVKFQVAVDRRDHLKRATNISLLDESFNVSGEKREQGVVCSLKDGFGFIRCVEREHSIFFYFAEVLRLGQELSVGDEVEFTASPVPSFTNTSNRLSAIRIKHLPPGTVTFENLMERGVCGVVSKEAINVSTSPNKLGQPNESGSGIIAYTLNGVKKSITYVAQNCKTKMLPRVGDKVEFDIYQVKRTKELLAMAIHVQHSASNGRNSNGNSNPSHRVMMQGFIAALKDGFGFIETADHNKEVFFHFSYLEGNLDTLELGNEVEYLLGRHNTSNSGCASAEYVRPLPSGSIRLAKPLEHIVNGTVTRTLRALNPDQSEYSGSIEAEDGKSYEFGIMGLSNKREILQVGDAVTFQIDEKSRAANIVPSRNKRQAIVDAIKGGFGFLSLDGEDNRRLFFHMSEVRANPSDLQPGDMVEFVLVTNPRNGKSSACNVSRISGKTSRGKGSGARPERLLARFRATTLEEGAGPRVLAVRAPRGPDGTKGFLPRRPINDSSAE